MNSLLTASMTMTLRPPRHAQMVSAVIVIVAAVALVVNEFVRSDGRWVS